MLYKEIKYDCGCIYKNCGSTSNSCTHHPNSIIQSVELSYIDIINILIPEISKTWGKIKSFEAVEEKGIKFNLEQDLI